MIQGVFKAFERRKEEVRMIKLRNGSAARIGRSFRRHLRNRVDKPTLMQGIADRIKYRMERNIHPAINADQQTREKWARLIVITQDALSFQAAAVRDALQDRASVDMIRFMKTVADKESTKIALIAFQKRFLILSERIKQFKEQQNAMRDQICE